jgi:hypothetical protein|nr:hypothetical protein [Candidatus Krumholzibacteria bacterium]
MLNSKLTVLCILLILSTSLVQAAPPVVSNVEVHQIPGTFHVEVNFDVSDTDNDMLQMILMFSSDGGQTWPTRCDSLGGDVWLDGPGSGKSITWYAAEEVPDFQGSNCRLRLFATDDFLPPALEYFRVVGTDTLAMASMDTIGYGEPLHLFWKGATAITDGLDGVTVAQMDGTYPFDDGILGYKWRYLGDHCVPDLQDCWHPRYYEEATGDSVSYFGAGQSLFFTNDNSGTDVFSRRLDSGEVPMAFNAQDIVLNEMPQYGQEFSFVVNYRPQTIMLDGETDWAHPEDSQVYPYYIRLNDPAQTKVPFVDGDRIPDRTYVVFKALFKDDARDLILDPDAMGMTGNFFGTRDNWTGGQYSFQSQASPINMDPTWGMGADGWFADTLGFMTAPRCEFHCALRGVDEHGARGVPAGLSFSVGLEPCVQCIEILPSTSEASNFNADLDCYDPGSVGHACFDGDYTFYIKSNTGETIPGRSYLDVQGLAYLVIDKVTHFAQFMDEEPNPELYYSFPCNKYSLGVLLHGRDDAQEAWANPLWRTLAWQYQVDYSCDPLNSIADGGGVDNLLYPTWGVEDGEFLEVDPVTGVWKLGVEVLVPQMMVNVGAETFRQIILFTMAGGDVELADELFNICLRQLSEGTVSAVAMDQTRCDVPPYGRPARYHVFQTVRPPLADPGPGATWRDCDPFWPNVQYSLDLDRATMQSNGGEPVVQPFQLIFQDTDGTDVTCDPWAGNVLK